MGVKKTTKGTESSPSVELKKQTNRDLRKMYHGSVGEAYANVVRENEKADYIKNLLM